MNKKNINEEKFEYIVNKYGLEKVNDLINNLSEKKKLAIYMCFFEKKSYKEISNTLNICNSNTFINRILQEIELNLDDSKVSIHKETFNRLINNYGVSSVLSIINKMNEKEKNIMSLFFGLNGNEKKTYLEINKVLKINYSSKLIDHLLDKLENKLEDLKVKTGKTTSKDNYEQLLNQYGEETVLKAMSCLNDKCKKILELYLGLNNNESKSLKEINDIMNITDGNKWIYYSLKRMRELIETNLNNVYNKKLLSNYFINNDRKSYEQLMLNNFDLVRSCIKELINIPYMNQEEINEEFFSIGCIGLHKAIVTFPKDKLNVLTFNSYASKCICDELSKEYKKYINDIMHNKEEYASLENVFEDDDSIENFIEEDYKKYINKIINEALAKRSFKTRIIMESYYGLNGKTVKTPREISEENNISYAFIRSCINKTNIYLKEFIISKCNNKISVKRK